METVEEDGPASRAGVQQGDLIVAFDGHAVNGIDDLHRVLTAERIGAAVPMIVLRAGRKLELHVLPAEAPGKARPFGQ